IFFFSSIIFLIFNLMTLQSLGACTDATHGMTLSAVSLPYYKYILPYGLSKFVRFAKNVWNIDENNKTDKQIAWEGLQAMEDWMKDLGLVLKSSQLGATEEMIPDLVNGTFIMDGGYKVLNRKEIEYIFKESL
ncbi:MAG: iron-containing alcohol dehydrogenase, partial [Floccifex sp.]